MLCFQLSFYLYKKNIYIYLKFDLNHGVWLSLLKHVIDNESNSGILSFDTSVHILPKSGRTLLSAQFMTMSSMYDNNILVFDLNSNIVNMRFSTCSEAFDFSSCDHTLQQNLSRYWEMGEKETYLTGAWVGNFIALSSIVVLFSLQIFVYLFNNDHGHLSVCVWRRGKDMPMIRLVPSPSFAFPYHERKGLQILRFLYPVPYIHVYMPYTSLPSLTLWLFCTSPSETHILPSGCCMTV